MLNIFKTCKIKGTLAENKHKYNFKQMLMDRRTEGDNQSKMKNWFVTYQRTILISKCHMTGLLQVLINKI